MSNRACCLLVCAAVGFSSLPACSAGGCSCTLESLASPSAVLTFDFVATCSSPEVMRRLMREHCLKGMELEPESPQPSPG